MNRNAPGISAVRSWHVWIVNGYIPSVDIDVRRPLGAGE
jgi:hypothetical protein